MKKQLIYLLVFLFLATITGCNDDPSSPSELDNDEPEIKNDEPEINNDAPEILTISASPVKVGKSKKSKLSVVATDKNNDVLRYEWSCSDGVFLQGRSSKIATWKAPDKLGNYECQVMVSDGIDTTTGTVSVDVVEIPILKIADEPLDLSFNLTSCSFQIENAGKAELNWKVSPRAYWITVSPTEGTTNTEVDEVGVSIDKTRFAAGDFQGLIRVESNGGNINILVKFTVLITPEMVFIAAGEFQMGSLEESENEQPVHNVYLEGFWIDKYEVTNQQYVDFLNELYGRNEIKVSYFWGDDVVYKDDRILIHIHNGALAYRGIDCPISFEDHHFMTERGTENHPVCFLTWYGARAYAEYYGKRLPTEAEWERTARSINSRKYPWGNWDASQYHCNYTMKVGHPTMVGAYPMGDSKDGCADMAGNAWEWCSSLYKAYPYDADDGREDLSAEGYRTIRGGGWDSITASLRSSRRYYHDPTDFYISYGMRCARSDN